MKIVNRIVLKFYLTLTVPSPMNEKNWVYNKRNLKTLKIAEMILLGPLTDCCSKDQLPNEKIRNELGVT